MLKSIEVLTEISKHSFDFYTELAARTSTDVGFEKKGLLMVSATESGVRDALAEMRLMAERGIRGQALNRDELLHVEPLLKPIVKGGVLFPDEAQTEPFLTTGAIAREFTALGGHTALETEVFDFTISDRGTITEVITTKGRFRPDLVVLAAGSWSPAVARKLRLRVPVLGGKGYSMSVEGVRRKPARPMMIVDRKVAITPWANSVRLAGTLELVNQDFSISPRRLAGIYDGTHEFLNLEHDGEARKIWRGLRPCTPDGVPLIGFSKKISNLFYCTGHQMLGLQSAPGSARLAADLIQKRTPYVDPKPFQPERF
jgi:D-amino-acid dehydrogenase